MQMKQLKALLTGALLLQGAHALAQEGRAEFYRGKTVTIVVGFEPGGGYDAYMRLIARHMGDHLPGQPKIIVQNMPGAGTRVAANWLYTVAPRDGTTLGSLVQSTPIDQVLGEPGARFDAGQFNWIGNPIIDNLVTLSSSASGFNTMEDVKGRRGLICGSSGGGPTVTTIAGRPCPGKFDVCPGPSQCVNPARGGEWCFWLYQGKEACGCT